MQFQNSQREYTQTHSHNEVLICWLSAAKYNPLPKKKECHYIVFTKHNGFAGMKMLRSKKKGWKKGMKMFPIFRLVPLWGFGFWL